MLLAYRLVRLIEKHSDELAQNLLAQVQTSEKTAAFSRVPAAELRDRVYGIYRNLGDWLLGKTESEIEVRYCEIGARRAAQGVPFSQLVEAIILTKDTLWQFLMKEAAVDRPLEVFGELEMLQLLDQFFDRAIFYAALGYESAPAGAKAAGAA
jgi:hypothetical protein